MNLAQQTNQFSIFKLKLTAAKWLSELSKHNAQNAKFHTNE